MATISDLINLKAMAVYYTRRILTLPPYAGEAYFTPVKIATDVLSYLSQDQRGPRLAVASKYDAEPTPVNREDFAKETFQTNFFRTKRTLNEADIEEINRAVSTNDDALLQSLIIALFDDKTQQLLDHRARREWMAMQALMTGVISIKSNGVNSVVAYSTDPKMQGQVATDWSDTTNANPFKDIQDAEDTMKQVRGLTPNQILMNTETFRQIQHNEKVKASLWPNNANTPQAQLSQNAVADAIMSEFHVVPVIYDQGFTDKDAKGKDVFNPYIPTGKVVLMNAPIPTTFALTGSTNTGIVQGQPIGHMAFAPTPEELGVRNGRIASNTVQMFDTGVAYHEYYNGELVQTEDLTSMNCLPSFEGSQSIFRLTTSVTQSGK